MATIAQLISKEYHYSEIKEHVIRVVNFRFPEKEKNTILFQDATLASDVYSAAERIPSDTTVNEFSDEGYIMNGSLYEGSELTTCYKRRKVYIMKGLTHEEYKRAQGYSTAFGNSYSLHVIAFELAMSTKGKAFMIMPAMRYSVDKVPSPFLAPDDVQLLWSHMESALSTIHSGGFAFMDI